MQTFTTEELLDHLSDTLSIFDVERLLLEVRKRYPNDQEFGSKIAEALVNAEQKRKDIDENS